jgi:hypothetical protein
MIGISCIQKLLELISGQPCLVLDLTLSGSDELLVRVANILVVVTLIVASGVIALAPSCHSLCPFLCTCYVLRWCPLTTTGSCLLASLDENDANHLQWHAWWQY